MIFPFNFKSRIRDPFEPASRIDRELGERGRRLFIGIELDKNLRDISAALTVVEGKGKYLRVVGVSSCRSELEIPIQNALVEFLADESPTLLDWRAIQHDVAMSMAVTVEQLKIQAGKYVDRLVAVAINDPGLRTSDSESATVAFPLCDPNLLAETTGITVVDSFKNRDYSSGGSGTGLFSLPAWLLFADRATPIANQQRVFLRIGPQSQAYFIPASDGLDVEVPDIRYAELNCLEILRQHFDVTEPGYESEIHTLNIQGQSSSELVDAIRQQLGGSTAAMLPSIQSQHDQANFTRSYLVALVDELLARINVTGDKSISEVVVDANEPLIGSAVNQVQRALPSANVKSSGDCIDQSGASAAVFTSILGAMNIDQLPGNIPWITGASSQRILGRITAGCPSNWRLVLREMADFQPPAMRLRDAI